jgi:hypothetical protein
MFARRPVANHDSAAGLPQDHRKKRGADRNVLIGLPERREKARGRIGPSIRRASDLSTRLM